MGGAFAGSPLRVARLYDIDPAKPFVCPFGDRKENAHVIHSATGRGLSPGPFCALPCVNACAVLECLRRHPSRRIMRTHSKIVSYDLYVLRMSPSGSSQTSSRSPNTLIS